MSLFIIGSISRITSKIVHHIAKNSQYKSVTIGDLLPSYDFHNRFYRLQKQLDENQSTLQVNLTKIHNLNDLKAQDRYDDVLYVTHDYYQSVTSKTRLMELTASACKGRKYLYFATPVEYDHFGYANPEAKYTESQKKIFEINPNSTVIRSDIQQSTQLFATINKSSLSNYKPQIVRSQEYAKLLCDNIAARVQGKRILLRGTQAVAQNSTRSYRIDQSQYIHAKENITNLVAKYGEYKFNGYEDQGQKVQKAAQ